MSIARRGARISKNSMTENTTELAARDESSSELAIAEPSKALAIIPAEKMELLKETIMPGASDTELDFFVEVCNRTNLDPFRNEIHPVKRRVNVKGQWVERWTFQCGIDGYRKRAAATGRYAGSEVVSDPQNGKHPEISKATVWRVVGGERVPFTADARWSEYCQTDRQGHPIAMWARMPYTMLEKCAEAKALRKAFPNELNGVYAEEEMQHDPNRKIRTLEDEEEEIEIVGVSENKPEATDVEVEEIADASAEDIIRENLSRAGFLDDELTEALNVLGNDDRPHWTDFASKTLDAIATEKGWAKAVDAINASREGGAE